VTAKLLGALLAWIVRILVYTWRVRVILPEGLSAARQPIVFAFWHGQQLGLLAAARRRPALVMVSHSKDGAIQTGVMSRLGFRVVRGSTSRGALRATKTIVEELRARELDAVFAADGPRGPQHQAKPGAAKVAELAGALLVPLASAASHCFVLRGAWDRFEIPLPFARVVIVAHPPINPLHPTLLTTAIDAASAAAKKEISHPVGCPPSGTSKGRHEARQEGRKGGRIFEIGERRTPLSEPKNSSLRSSTPSGITKRVRLPFSSCEIPDPNSPRISAEKAT
jgi:lysophospholipid acyltransferase (LPLAT)-like uncharacterized protein